MASLVGSAEGDSVTRDGDNALTRVRKEPLFDPVESEDEPCSHCGGEGTCYDGSDPLGDCPDEPHDCHACGGSGRAEDQVIW